MSSKAITHLTFLDVETTGLDPETNEIVELCAARLDIRTRELDWWYHRLIHHTQPLGFVAEHFEGVDWSQASDLSKALLELTPKLEGETLAGQTPQFDLRFLKAGYKKSFLAFPTVDYHVIDVSSMVFPLVTLGIVEGISLKHTRLWAGRTGPQLHRASPDVLDTVEVFLKCVDTFAAGVGR